MGSNHDLGGLMRCALLYVVVSISVTASAVAAEWAQNTVGRFQFSGTFPSEPKVEESVEDGVKLTTYLSAVPGVLCLATIGDYPSIPSVEEELNASRDNFIKAMKGEITSSVRSSFFRGTTELPSLKFEGTSETLRFQSIIVVEKARVYMILGGVPKDGGAQGDIDRCVGGFALTP